MAQVVVGMPKTQGHEFKPQHCQRGKKGRMRLHVYFMFLIP
jgi:hypothetical protein